MAICRRDICGSSVPSTYLGKVEIREKNPVHLDSDLQFVHYFSVEIGRKVIFFQRSSVPWMLDLHFFCGVGEEGDNWGLCLYFEIRRKFISFLSCVLLF